MKKRLFAIGFSLLLIAAILVPSMTVFAASAGWPALSTSNYMKVYTISTGNSTPAYGSKSTSNQIGTIYAADELYVYSISGSWVYLSYPTSSGRNNAYVPLSTITAATETSFTSTVARATVTTYRRASTANSFGSISSGDTVLKIKVSGSYVQVLYPISGGYKLGWVTQANYDSYIAATAVQGIQGTYYAPIQTGATFSSNTENGFRHDIAVANGTPIYAIANGTLSFQQAYTTISGTKYLTSYGNNIRFTSTDGSTTAIYAHLASFVGVSLTIPASQTKQQSGSDGALTLGSRTVSKGDIIGYVGKTGNATGYHLHFELRINGTRVNPPSYVGLT